MGRYMVLNFDASVILHFYFVRGMVSLIDVFDMIRIVCYEINVDIFLDMMFLTIAGKLSTRTSTSKVKVCDGFENFVFALVY